MPMKNKVNVCQGGGSCILNANRGKAWRAHVLDVSYADATLFCSSARGILLTVVNRGHLPLGTWVGLILRQGVC